MPLDVRGCTRATLKESACCTHLVSKGLGNPMKLLRDWDRELQLFPLNEEFPVSAGHQLALITSLPFVHTARRYYRIEPISRGLGTDGLRRFHGRLGCWKLDLIASGLNRK